MPQQKILETGEPSPLPQACSVLHKHWTVHSTYLLEVAFTGQEETRSMVDLFLWELFSA